MPNSAPAPAKVCLVTGASRGLGRAICDSLREAGHRVHESMRTPTESHQHFLDVTDRASVERAVAELIKEEGRIDVLVNNAGYGLAGTVEMASDEEMQRQFDVNVFGAVRVIQAVLPHMRAQDSGTIINISSLAGIRPSPTMAIYAATKFALEGLTQSLAVSLAPWDIHALVVEPGWTRTDFVENIQRASRQIEGNPYDRLVDEWRATAAEEIKEGQDPVEIGQLICDIIASDDPAFRNPTMAMGRKAAAALFVEPTGNEWVKERRAHYRDLF